MALLLALTIALMALILAPGFSFYFDITPKLVVLLAGTAIVLVCVPLPDGRGSVRHPVFRIFSILLVLNLLSLALSTALSARPGLSLFGTNWRRYGSVIQGAILLFTWLVAMVCAGRPERVKTVLRGIVVAGAVSAVYGIAQYFGWDPLLPAAAYHLGEADYVIVRPPGTLGYASYFATWLLLVVFLGRALAAMEDSIAWRRFAIGVTPLAGFAMLLTGTRAAILGLAVGGVVWMAIKKARVTRRIAGWAAVAVIAGVVFYYSPSGQQMRSRARWFAEDPWGGVRGHLWRDSLRMAANRLGAGYGPEVFTGEFPAYESVELARAYPAFSHESPHNIFLDVLVAQGLPGFLALMGLCALPFITGRRAELTAALAAALVSQQFTAFTIPTAVIFFTVLALVVALETPAVQVRGRLPLTAVAAALAVGLLFLAVRFMLADLALASTKQALDEGNLRSAAADYVKYQRLRLPGGTADLWYSRAVLGIVSKSTIPLERLSAVAESGAAAQRATETAEDPFNAWYNLAVVYGFQNDAAGSERSLRAAIAAHPTWFKPHWMLAQVLRLEGRLEAARREALLAGELDAGKDPEVARTVEEFEVHPQPLQR
jgi:O-antigen ligase